MHKPKMEKASATGSKIRKGKLIGKSRPLTSKFSPKAKTNVLQKITPVKISQASYNFSIIVTNNIMLAKYSGTSLKGHNTFDLSIKDKFYGPYRTMAI